MLDMRGLQSVLPQGTSPSERKRVTCYPVSMADNYTIKSWFCGAWRISPEVDFAWYYSALRKLIGTYGLVDFDIRVERGEGDPDYWGDRLRFSLVITAENKKSAREMSEEIFSAIS